MGKNKNVLELPKNHFNDVKKVVNKIACFKVKLNWTRGLFFVFPPYGQGQRYNKLKPNSCGKQTQIFDLNILTNLTKEPHTKLNPYSTSQT